MLRDGRFIKEQPPQIGRFYLPSSKDRVYTREEVFAQSVVLGYEGKKGVVLSKVLSFILRI